ncbi:MAG TPA: tRNA dihydrouridine synthase DusB [Pseudobdellovibrionaceae bacterium]|nr:tRNA dihydrouridine synthase DusB [Pseudobdellovibrionaceae bacterium]
MTHELLLQHLKQNPFVLAPMAGITDHAFRSFMRKYGAGVVVTELVSATGISYESSKTLDLMSFDEKQRPIGIQLFGEDPETLGQAAAFAQNTGCDFIDLNFGCPVPKVVKKGAGSAVLKDLKQLQKILSTVRRHIEIPLTIKIRTGWDANSRNAHEVCHIAAEEGITWVSIHGRTRAQGYSGESDWDYISQVKKDLQGKIAILGNGDIHTPEQAVERLQSSQCEGVMIGRACLKNPLIFLQSYSIWNHLNHPSELKTTPIISMGEIYLELFHYLSQHCAEHILSIQLRKFASWFSSGYPGAAQFRKVIFQCQEKEEILNLALEFFNRLTLKQQQDTFNESFLMGGHG